MIRADELPADFPPDISKQEAVEMDLDEEDQALLYALDADLETVAVQRRLGEMFESRITREIPHNVIAALKRVWEAGGWTVGVFEVTDADGRPLRDQEDLAPEQAVYRMVFARAARPTAALKDDLARSLQPPEEAQEFEMPDEATVQRATSGHRSSAIPLLIRMPTRARPLQALEVLEKYRSMATGEVALEVIIDEDDPTCNQTQFLQRLSDLDATVTIGRHRSKIEACNAGRRDDWSVLMLASDDMVPVVRGYDQKIMSAFEQHFPMLDGALNFHDGYNRDHVREGEPVTCTLPILGRHLYEIDNYVYWPQYKSIYCDTDQTFVFNALHRMVFIDEMIVEHRHFANSKARFDELYQNNSRHDDHDRLLFEQRRAANFNIIKPQLSLLICAVPARRRQLDRLVDFLRWQMRDHRGQVEICVDLDERCTVGAKRQRLLERAVGRYIAFIDDDDWVDSRYVTRVLRASYEDKDCCSLIGVITENNAQPRRFEHLSSYREWFTREDGVYARTPNHLNAVRRDLALKAGFVSQNVGEDHLYSQRLRPLIQSEASTGDTPLYYYWSRPQKSVQSQGGPR